MTKLIFTEEFCQPENLHPFTLTRQIQDIRTGILSIREKWEWMMGLSSYDKKEDDYKDLERSVNIDEAIGDGVCLMVHGNLLPTAKLVKEIKKLKNGEVLTGPSGNGLVYRITRQEIVDRYKIKVGRSIPFAEPVKQIQYPWDRKDLPKNF
jgi:hypothetical protein